MTNNKGDDLNDLIDRPSEWHLYWAEGINDSGYIVGYGICKDEKLPPLLRSLRAFLLTPIIADKKETQ